MSQEKEEDAMAELRSIGWVLQMSRARYLDAEDGQEEVYAVNLVRPVGNPVEATGKEIFAERGPAFDLDDVKPLLFPWRWIKTWRLFGLPKVEPPPDWQEIPPDPEEPWTVETGTLRQDQIDDVKGFWEATESELMKRCKGFEHPFSGHPDDVEAREPDEELSQSFVHAIAPFTHLVAPVSNAALGLAGFLRVPATTAADFTKLVLFPDVGLTEELVLNVKDDAVKAWPVGSPNSVHALYEPDLDLGDGQGVAVCFLSQVAECGAAEIAAGSSTLTDAAAHPARWKIEPALEAAAHHLHPARMVAGVVLRATEWTEELDPDERDRWRRLLVQVLGLGWDRSRHDFFGGRAEGHVLDGTAKEPELSALFGETRWVDVLDPAWVDDPLAVLTQFHTFLKSSATPPIRRLFEQAHLHDEHPVVEWSRDVVSEESAPFRSSWAKLVFTATDRDPEKALDLRLLWWLFGIDEKAHTRALLVVEELVKNGAGKEALEAWTESWATLRTKVLTRVIEAMTTRLGDRSMLGELDRLPAPIPSVWAPLKEYVESGQTASLEGWIAGWIWKDAAGDGWLAPPCRLSGVDCSHLCAEGGECYDAGSEKCDEACFETRCDALHREELERLTVEPIHQMDKFVESSKPDRIRAKDTGFPLVLEVPEDVVDDTAIRGQAVVLRSGARLGGGEPAWDDERAQWITGTTVAYKSEDSMKFLKTEASGAIWSTATVGSSLSGGHRVVELVYEGGPACAVATAAAANFEAKDRSDELDYDGTEVLDYLWLTTERDLPLLGYGMTYSAARTAVDNAGGIFQPKLRSGLAEVAPPSSKLPYEVLGEYLSWEPPGPPMLWVDDATSELRPPRPEDFALSSQTRAAQIERQRVEAEGTADPRDVPNVAFLRPFGSKLYQEHRPDAYEVVIRPPGTHADFIERWLNTDILTLEKGPQAPGGNSESLLSDIAFKDARDDVIDLRNRLCGALRRKSDEQSAEDLDRDPGLYHPAVTGIGVEIDLLDGSDPTRTPHKIVRLADKGIGKPERFNPSKQALVFRILANSRHGDIGSYEESKSSVYAELRLAPGSSARVRFYSLIEDRFFEGNTSIHRYHEAVAEGRGEAFPGYRAFGVLELWFEVGPDVEVTPTLGDDLLCITAPTLHNPNLSQLQLQDQVVPAEWLRGLRITRHELHWTGYPVRYPDPESADIGDWLPSFAGVESAVDTKEVILATELENGSWRVVPKQGVGRPRILHDGHRPAGYSGYTARPIVRFREWLRPGAEPLKLERDVLAVGALERGRAASPREARLLAPALTSGGPLTASFDAAERASGSLPDRAPNGHLLILEEPLYDTMPSAVTGGIGEVIEVDLLETRKIKVAREAADEAEGSPGPDDEEDLRSFREIGPNPIFHEQPKLEEQAEMEIVASEPFGLTDDLVRNAKVRQTGIVLTPRNTGGRWTLAKIRARRMILPETLLVDPIPRATGAKGDGTSAGAPAEAHDLRPYRLPLRPAGDENVPADFVIDATEVWTNPAIRVAGCARDLKLPSEVPAGHRLVCSWHKGRFEKGQVSWRAQVLLQEPIEGELRWKTTEKLTPYVQPDWEPVVALTPQESEEVVTRAGAVDLVLKPDLVDAVRPAHLSDYTEPEWVLFIGTFGKSEIGRADEYSLALRSAGAPAAAPELELLGPELPMLTAPEQCLNGDHLRFQLLHLYRPIDSIAHGEPDRTGGVQVAVFAPRVAEDGTATSTFRCYSCAEDGPARSLDGCYGYLVTYQRISSRSVDEKEKIHEKIDGWEALLSGGIFPDQEGGWVEATVRPVPEYLGPISIMAWKP